MKEEYNKVWNGKSWETRMMNKDKKLSKPGQMINENYESDNYDAGFNQACADWQAYHDQEMKIVNN